MNKIWFISTKQRGLLDDIRYLGNDAAHRADSKSRKRFNSPFKSFRKFNSSAFCTLQVGTVIKDSERFQFESYKSAYTVDIRVQKLIVPHQALTLLVLEDAQKSIKRFNN